MKVLILTNEYPPHIYGGAGVHVEYLTRELARLCEVEVRCFGDQELAEKALTATGFGLDRGGWTAPEPLQSVFGALRRCLDFNTRDIDADLVHVHTWYTHFGGVLAKLNYGIPLALTVHSLEPLRPWKREQLGGGYDFSLWIEKTTIEMADAVVAVSNETREDVLRLFEVDPSRVPVIHNGIDPDEYREVEDPERLRRFGIDPARPYVLFVGRITRQKGIIHLVDAIRHLDAEVPVVLCAGAPDTPEIAREMTAAVEAARAGRPDGGVIWIQEMVDVPTKVALYSHAAVFCCPSIYEPFGIINLEAMACGTAVVASKVGGMKEVVVDGETGLLVPLEQHLESPFAPVDPARFAADLASALNELMRDPARREAMGQAGRRRVVDHFSWRAIAAQTHELYRRLAAGHAPASPGNGAMPSIS